MTSSNSTQNSAIDSHTATFARITLSDKSNNPPIDLFLTVHPKTLSGLTSAALIAKVPLLDFVLNSAWERASELLRLQQMIQAEQSQQTSSQQPKPTKSGLFTGMFG